MTALDRTEWLSRAVRPRRRGLGLLLLGLGCTGWMLAAAAPALFAGTAQAANAGLAAGPMPSAGGTVRLNGISQSNSTVRSTVTVPSSGTGQTAPGEALDLQGKAEALAGQAGLAPTEWALLLYSTAQERALVQWRAEAPMIAASNAKLATSYAALRTLGPNHRWRTRFFLIADHDGAAGALRQGLLVQGGADPTLTLADLDEVARRLRAGGVAALPLGLFLDGSRFPGQRVPGSGPPPPDLEVSALAQEPSAFILNHNAVDVQVAWRPGHAPVIPADLPAGLVTVLPHLQEAPQGRTVLRARQAWSAAGLELELSGSIAPGRHHLAVPVARPEPWFARGLALALERQGIPGPLTLHAALPPHARRRLLFSHLSPPLRDTLTVLHKNSDNLLAESLVWAMGGLSADPPPPPSSGAEMYDRGLQRLRDALAQDLPQAAPQAHLEDGAGLSRRTTVSAEFLVSLLRAVLRQPDLAPEYLASLSLAGWDGTLAYRDFPEELQGRIRAKTGTLTGVQNLSGILDVPHDRIVFAFLLHAPHSRAFLQNAQDRVLTALFDQLSGAPQPTTGAGNTPPAAPAPSTTPARSGSP